LSFAGGTAVSPDDNVSAVRSLSVLCARDFEHCGGAEACQPGEQTSAHYLAFG
jgi:hypothetical protein